MITSSHRLYSLLVACAILSIACSPAPESSGQAPPPPNPQIAVLEKALKPGRILAGDEEKTYSLSERMKHYRIPGLSIAVIEDGKLAWAKGYGVTAADTENLVNENTRFQAASVSKVVAALGAVLLAQSGAYDLDADVNTWLKNWQLPPMEGDSTAVTAKMLMSHTAGLTVSGFPGYEPTEAIPDAVQLLDGKPPANTDPVRITAKPGSQWRYSGGGYTILQLLVENVSGMGFAECLRERVLDPLRMDNSTFAVLALGANNVALAHNSHGVTGTSRWHVYPELAAAGLWTTPTDLARFLSALLRAGEPQNPVTAEIGTLMTTPVMNNYALGIIVHTKGGVTVWSHGGSNWGYRCGFLAWPERRLGIVVMTNGDNGSSLVQEVTDAFARLNDLPVEAPQVLPVDHNVTPEQLAELAGAYGVAVIEHDFVVAFRDDALFLEDSDLGTWPLYAKAPDQLFALDLQLEMNFVRDAAGTVSGAKIVFSGREFTAERKQP